jgi:hypothetical protein
LRNKEIFAARLINDDEPVLNMKNFYTYLEEKFHQRLGMNLRRACPAVSLALGCITTEARLIGSLLYRLV